MTVADVSLARVQQVGAPQSSAHTHVHTHTNHLGRGTEHDWQPAFRTREKCVRARARTRASRYMRAGPRIALRGNSVVSSCTYRRELGHGEVRLRVLRVDVRAPRVLSLLQRVLGVKEDVLLLEPFLRVAPRATSNQHACRFLRNARGETCTPAEGTLAGIS